jgi:2-polyprenyl-3-methyl-5-hydroxy-6-metoxy-1,4-benzoquinol methylase
VRHAAELDRFYAPAYHEHMTGGASDSERSRAYRRENEIRATELRRYVDHGKVLDVGCSRGDFARAIADTGLEAHGLDIAPEACALAEQNLGAGRVICGPLESHATDLAGRFSAVTLMDVIEHSSNAAEMLQAIHCVLEPGGILFLRTPTLSSPFHALASLSYRMSLGLYKAALLKLYHAEHVYFFNEASMKRLLDDCGFDTLELIPDPLCWENFRTAEMNQGPLANGVLAATHFIGRAANRGHGMKVIARRRPRQRPFVREGST